LDYQFPTVHAGDVKMFVLAVGAGLAVIAFGIGLASQPLVAEGDSTGEAAHGGDGMGGTGSAWRSGSRHVAPLLASQVLVGLLLLWSFASARWSAAPILALGAGFLLLIQYVWSFVLGYGLRARGAAIATRLIWVVSGVTAAIAIWYYMGRNPNLRAKFPFGNPSFLAASLIPGLLLALAGLAGYVAAGRELLTRRGILGALGCLVVFILSAWAFYLSHSRGATLGLAVGAVAGVFFAVRGRWKLAPCLLAIVFVGMAASHFLAIGGQASGDGRGATIRFRLYAWDYAWRMFTERPLAGHGQGGFVLKGDSYAAEDVLDDPEIFSARISHAHNEWLETLADLGAVGRCC
jgi:O-antigen ligase